MKIIHGIKKIKRFNRPVAALGVFDGMHVGHIRILKEVASKAKKAGGTAVVISFYPHPDRVLMNKKYPLSIISLQHRLRIMAGSGLDVCIVLKFNKSLAGMRPEDFVKEILVRRLGLKEVMVGENFSFGRGGRGNVALLKKMGKEYGFRVRAIPSVKAGKRIVSSTRVRQEIKSGNLTEIKRLLGRPFSILGTVKHGTKQGRILGFPTANIDPHHEAIPPSGAYVVRSRLGNRMYGGVLNIGTRPTFGGKDPVVEVHLFNFNKTIYGKDLEIYFVKHIRSEKKFTSRQSLARQIRRDALLAKKILRG